MDCASGSFLCLVGKNKSSVPFQTFVCMFMNFSLLEFDGEGSPGKDFFLSSSALCANHPHKPHFKSKILLNLVRANEACESD